MPQYTRANVSRQLSDHLEFMKACGGNPAGYLKRYGQPIGGKTMLWIIAMAYATIETAHFGWNVTAHSDAEMICDGIGFVLFAIAAIRSK